MKAISLHQPWASYIADGRKTIETRTWYTEYRGDLLICSTRKPALKGFPLGMALAIVELYDCRPMTYNDQTAAAFPWQKGLFAWCLRDIRRISPPFSVKGKQGFFEVDI